MQKGLAELEAVEAQLAAEDEFEGSDVRPIWRDAAHSSSRARYVLSSRYQTL